MKLPTALKVDKIERWVSDHSIAIVVRYNDGSGMVQVLNLNTNPDFMGASVNTVKFAGLWWIDAPVVLHAQVQNSRRYAIRNLI